MSLAKRVLRERSRRFPSEGTPRQAEEKQKRIKFLEKKMQIKDEIRAELTAEHIAFKKKSWEL